MRVRVTSITKDQNARGTVVMRKTGTTGAGVMQTSRPVLMRWPIQHQKLRMFRDMELAKLPVPQVYKCVSRVR